MKLVKLAFFADLEHIARYGRPIVGGNYVAMPFGPVASLLLDDLNGKTNQPPFKLITKYDVTATAPVNEAYLSESDLEVLREVNTKYGDMDEFTLSRLTHDFAAWRKNYPDDGSSHPLPYEDFFLDIPEDRQEMANIIRDRQDAWALLA